MKVRQYTIILGLFNLLAVQSAFSQKKLSELTLVYAYSISSANSDSKPGSSTVNAVNTVYLKANLSRVETTSTLFSSVSIYDSKTGTGVILKEVSGQKLLIRMTSENWQDRNKRFQGITFTNTSETKTIAGYKCIKAIAKMNNGTTLEVYYTRDILTENRDYDVQFKNLDGLPLEYELTNGNIKIKYTLSSINLNPVPVSKFDIPKSGYRELTYDESKKMNIGG